MTQRQTNSAPQSSRAMTSTVGWLSIGIGLAELMLPRTVNGTIGQGENHKLLQYYGMRGVASGVGILTSDNPAPWLWSRVAGDALDLATLMPALSADNPNRRTARMVAAGVAAVTLLDIYCAQAASRQASAARKDSRASHDYSDRSGFNRPISEMRGIAARDGKRQLASA